MGMYIPLMGFITYVLLCGLISGISGDFNPGVLSSTVTFAIVILTIEVAVTKATLYAAGALEAPLFDIVALLGYTSMYLSLNLIVGLVLGLGHQPKTMSY